MVSDPRCAAIARRLATPLRVAVAGRRGVGRRTVAHALTLAGDQRGTIALTTSSNADLDVYVLAEVAKPEDLVALSTARRPVLAVLNKADLIATTESGCHPRRADQCGQGPVRAAICPRRHIDRTSGGDPRVRRPAGRRRVGRAADAGQRAPRGRGRAASVDQLSRRVRCRAGDGCDPARSHPRRCRCPAAQPELHRPGRRQGRGARRAGPLPARPGRRRRTGDAGCHRPANQRVPVPRRHAGRPDDGRGGRGRGGRHRGRSRRHRCRTPSAARCTGSATGAGRSSVLIAPAAPTSSEAHCGCGRRSEGRRDQKARQRRGCRGGCHGGGDRPPPRRAEHQPARRRAGHRAVAVRGDRRGRHVDRTAARPQVRRVDGPGVR